MKLNDFFKTLNKKINAYDKIAKNPFSEKGRLVVVWIEDSDDLTKNHSP